MQGYRAHAFESDYIVNQCHANIGEMLQPGGEHVTKGLTVGCYLALLFLC